MLTIDLWRSGHSAGQALPASPRRSRQAEPFSAAAAAATSTYIARMVIAGGPQASQASRQSVTVSRWSSKPCFACESNTTYAIVDGVSSTSGANNAANKCGSVPACLLASALQAASLSPGSRTRHEN